MSFFRRPDYVSETTQFINGLKSAKPSLEAEQRHGRSLLWDRPQDRALQAQFQAARVAQKPYVYGSDPHSAS